MHLPADKQNTHEAEKMLRCCGAMADVLRMEGKFPFKDDKGEIFNWKNYKNTEKNIDKNKLIARMKEYKDREAAFNDDGCFLSSVVKKYCS